MKPRVIVTRDFRIHEAGLPHMTPYRRGEVVLADDLPWGHTAGQWLEKGLARWSWWTVAGWALLWAAS